MIIINQYVEFCAVYYCNQYYMCNTKIRDAFFINENQQEHFNIYITLYDIYFQDFYFFLEIFKNTPDKHKYFYYYIIIFLVF